MLVRMRISPSFFSSPREIASHMQSPFPLGSDIPIPPGGILIDCNNSLEVIQGMVAEQAEYFKELNPVTIVFGVHPSGISGEEFLEAREAQVDDAHATFSQVERILKSLGVKKVHRIFAETNAKESVDAAIELSEPELVLTHQIR